MPLLRPGPGLVRTAARTAVVAGTATAVSGRVARRQQQRSEQAAAQPAPAEQQAAPPPPAADEDDLTAKLQQLGELHANGVLDDAEFAAAKAKLLGT